MQETPEMLFRSLGWEDPLEKEMANRSSILAWEIPQTEEPGGLHSHGVARSQTRLHVCTEHWQGPAFTNRAFSFYGKQTIATN